jgi:outer membrane protein OmpA-like peptidoglycan-associated protein
MTKKRSFTFLAFALAAAASLGFSQTGDNGTATSKSTSINTVNATVLAPGGGVSAGAGVMGTPGVFPGFPEQNGTLSLYWNGPFNKVCKEKMEAGRGKHVKVNTDVLVPNGVSNNNNCIHLLNWSPFNPAVFYIADEVISVTNAIGKADESPEATLLAGLYDAKTKGHSNRCVAFLRERNEGVTTGFSIGSGGSSGMTPGPGMNNVTAAFATGGLIGKNTTRQVNRPEFRIVCLNDGPLNPPQLPSPPDQNQKKVEAPAAPQAPQILQPEPPAPPVQTIRIEVVTVPSAQVSIPAPLAMSASMPTAPAQSSIASCDIPGLTIYFAFNDSKVDPKYRDSIQAMASWLKSHPTCKVQVQGHASKEASDHFNDALGDDRARAVYNQLMADGIPPSDMIEHVSLGKYFPKGEYEPENRRVILVVQGPASGR